MYKRNDSVFQRIIRGMDEKPQEQPYFQLSRTNNDEEYQLRKQLQKMEERITRNVLEKISVSADVSKAIQEIKELRREIDRLGKQGG